MAGDWIKMRPSLLTNPKVNGIARILESDDSVTQHLANEPFGKMAEIVTRNVMRSVTVCSLLVLWGAANEHTKDGVFHNADLSDIDDIVGLPGFGKALESVGWAEFDETEMSVTLPNFNEYNVSGSTRSAKAKTNAERQKEYRERIKSRENRNACNEENNVTSNRREEKRREEKNNITTHTTPSAKDGANPPPRDPDFENPPFQPEPTEDLLDIPDSLVRDEGEEFNRWYAAYPRKVGKGQAKKAFKAALKKIKYPDLLNAVKAYAKQVEAEGTEDRYIKHPATWLNGECWSDEDLNVDEGSGPAMSPADSEAAIWRVRVQGFVNSGSWPDSYGPAPDDPSCFCPPEVLAEFNFNQET